MDFSSKKEIINILKDDSQNDWLFSYADKIRKEYVGDKVHLRGLIEFSNICKKTCKYCGLRCENKSIERYRILAWRGRGGHSAPGRRCRRWCWWRRRGRRRQGRRCRGRRRRG